MNGNDGILLAMVWFWIFFDDRFWTQLSLLVSWKSSLYTKRIVVLVRSPAHFILKVSRGTFHLLLHQSSSTSICILFYPFLRIMQVFNHIASRIWLDMFLVYIYFYFWRERTKMKMSKSPSKNWSVVFQEERTCIIE